MRIGLLLLFLLSLQVEAQNPISDSEKDFKDYIEKENKAFDDYKGKENEAIAAFLKERWQAYERMQAKPYPFKPVPLDIPKTIPEPIEQPDVNTLPIVVPDNAASTDTKPNDNKEVLTEPNETEELQNENEENNVSENTGTTNNSTVSPNENIYLPNSFAKQTGINFFGKTVEFGYESDFLISCKSADENGVSDYWEEMSKKNYGRLLGELVWLKTKYNLNDWGTFNFVKTVSENLLKNKNDQVCFQFFFMNQLLYDVRLAKSGSQLVILLPLKETTYGMSYLEINHKKYYITKEGNSSFYTFSKDLMKNQKEISLMMERPITFNDIPEKKTYVLKSGKTISIDYSMNMVNFLKDYPQAELEVLFNSKPSISMTESLRKEISPLISGMNEWEAVNFLLDFVQHQFKYKTDDEQFGKEKWFFPDDQLHYPYSDCEDRSVFFAYLIKNILHLDVIGLNYPEHVAVAIHFHGDVKGDSVLYKDQNYIICDPTYIGASAGMCMPQFKNSKPKVIEVNR